MLQKIVRCWFIKHITLITILMEAATDIFFHIVRNGLRWWRTNGLSTQRI